MKYPNWCMQCLEGGDDNPPIIFVEVNDSDAYEVRCERGHEFAVLVQQPRFELLFEMAATAVIDGYHREAVLSFNGCLENFYEFFCRATMWKKEMEFAAFDAAWAIEKYSERQLGAFVLV